MGVYSDPLQTDVSAAERARKQASTLLLPHLVLFFFVGFAFVSLLNLPHSAVPFICLSFILPSIFSFPPHSEDYFKTLEELWKGPAC